MNQKVTMIIRIVFGLFCIFFGLNKFIGFMSFPPIPGDGQTLMNIYFSSGFLKLIGALEVVFGAGMVIGKYVPLSLTILIAIMFNAVVFHALHDTATIGGAILGLVLGIVLVYGYKDRFSSLLSA